MCRPLALLALLALLLPSAATAAFVAGDNDRSLLHDGETRTYRVHVPPGWSAASAVPLVLDIHGWSANAAIQQGSSGFQAVSDREGFLVAWPQGLDNQWNAGVCCGNSTSDDVGFLRAMVEAIALEGGIDRRRVYVTGLSNGGAMSHKLACEASDLFAAAAPMAFPLPYPSLAHCQPARPIPVLMVMGLTDALIPYHGGSFGSAPATFARWRDLHGCSGDPALVPHGQGRCETFAPAQCASGLAVGLCSIVAQAFPGLFFDGHILYLNEDLDLAAEAWRFLSQYRQPAVPPVPPSTLAGVLRVRAGAAQARHTANWQVSIGSAAWLIELDSGALLEGVPSHRGRRAVLALDDAARATLLAEIAAAIAAATGAPAPPLALAPDVTLRVRFDAQGVPRQVIGSLPLLHGDGSGRRAGRAALRLRR